MQIDIPEAPEPDQARAAKMKRQGDEAFVKSDFSSAAKAYTQVWSGPLDVHTPGHMCADVPAYGSWQWQTKHGIPI